jgi:hypothetical protein
VKLVVVVGPGVVFEVVEVELSSGVVEVVYVTVPVR